MRIRVDLLAQARAAAGTSTDDIDCGMGTTVEQALILLAEKYGDVLRRILLDDQGKPQASVMLFVNEEQVSPDQPHELHHGDELTIMPPISGG